MTMAPSPTFDVTLTETGHPGDRFSVDPSTGLARPTAGSGDGRPKVHLQLRRPEGKPGWTGKIWSEQGELTDDEWSEVKACIAKAVQAEDQARLWRAGLQSKTEACQSEGL